MIRFGRSTAGDRGTRIRLPGCPYDPTVSPRPTRLARAAAVQPSFTRGAGAFDQVQGWRNVDHRRNDAGSMKDLLGFRLFARVARLGSISAGAKDCGLSQSQASRIIAELEQSLGARLLSRTTRVVTPTDAGERFLVRAEAILVAIDEARELGSRGLGASWRRSRRHAGQPRLPRDRAAPPGLHRPSSRSENRGGRRRSAAGPRPGRRGRLDPARQARRLERHGSASHHHPARHSGCQELPRRGRYAGEPQTNSPAIASSEGRQAPLHGRSNGMGGPSSSRRDRTSRSTTTREPSWRRSRDLASAPHPCGLVGGRSKMEAWSRS